VAATRPDGRRLAGTPGWPLRLPCWPHACGRTNNLIRRAQPLHPPCLHSFIVNHRSFFVHRSILSIARALILNSISATGRSAICNTFNIPAISPQAFTMRTTTILAALSFAAAVSAQGPPIGVAPDESAPEGCDADSKSNFTIGYQSLSTMRKRETGLEVTASNLWCNGTNLTSSPGWQ
jgi:hypothetical protein